VEIPALLVSVFMLAAAISLLMSPMPKVIARSLAVGFGYFGVAYAVIYVTDMDTDSRMFVVRLGLLLLSTIIIACVVAWRKGASKWKLQ
jgi:uncharacterized membrane protein